MGAHGDKTAGEHLDQNWQSCLQYIYLYVYAYLYVYLYVYAFLVIGKREMGVRGDKTAGKI